MADFDCISGRISIIGCGVPAGDAVLFINQLPGISVQNIEALADGNEQQTFLDVWADVTLRAYKKFEVLVKAQINKCHRITDKSVISCLVCEKIDLFDVALWYLLGTELMIERTSSDSVNRWTTVDLEKAEQLKEEFYVEFKEALSDAVLSINPHDTECDTGCAPCNGPGVHFIEQLP